MSAGPSPRSAPQRAYRFLGHRVVVESDRRSALELLDGLYDEFSDPGPPGPEDLRVSVRRRPGAETGFDLTVGERTVRLADEPATDFHAYSLLFSELLTREADHFFVHGAAVTDGRRTLVVAGPAGHGKTTLALALLRHGFRLLSDDFAPVRRRDGRIVPFPKRVGVRRRSSQETAPSRGAAALGDKWLLRLDDLPGGPAREPVPLTHLLLLHRPGDPRRAETYLLALVDGHADLAAELGETEGLALREATTPGGRPALEVTVPAAPEARAAFHAACARRRHRLLLCEAGDAPLSFQGPPRLDPVGGFSAAMTLMGEVLNRIPGGALLHGTGDRMGALIMELAERLAGVRMARLLPGPLEVTVSAVLDWMEAPRR